MNNSFIIADSGPLIAFGRLNLLMILNKTLGTIIIPKTVANESTQDQARPGAIAIIEAISQKIIDVRPDPILEETPLLNSILGKGESAAIALGFKLHIGLLIDEKLARSAAAQLNIKIIGTAGVLLLAKKKKLIIAVLPVIEQLKRLGYYLSDTLISEVAKLASGEIS